MHQYQDDSGWADSLGRAARVLEAADLSHLWVARDEVRGTCARVVSRFDADFATADRDMAYIFAPEQDAAENTAGTIALVRKWQLREAEKDGKGPENPSLAAMAAVAMAQAGLDPAAEPELADAVLTACVLGEIGLDLPYHNNIHFRKVLLHALRLVWTHNRLFEGTGLVLGRRKMAALMIAAAIHDLGHDGSSNISDHHHYEFARLEQRSFAMAAPLLRGAGADEALLEDVRMILMTTDVSPFGDPISPARQLRAAYAYHYDAEGEEELSLGKELAVLEERADLTMMCMLFHEADLMNSNGLAYEVSAFETALLSEEIGKEEASPEDLFLFLEKICHGGMCTEAWEALARANFNAIYTQALRDVRAGNTPYPSAHEAAFLKS